MLDLPQSERRSLGVTHADGTGHLAWAHRECMLREVVGGIGHLIAHDYWCLQQHDPDAGLTYHQSALLADKFVQVMGSEHAASIG